MARRPHILVVVDPSKPDALPSLPGAHIERVSPETAARRWREGARPDFMVVDTGAATTAGLLASLSQSITNQSGEFEAAAVRATVEVLLIEDSPGDAELIMAALDERSAEQRFVVRRAPTLSAGVALLQEESFDAILLDIHLPDAAGTAGVEAVRQASPFTPIICLTGLDDEGLALACIDAGAATYITKDSLATLALRRVIIFTLARVRRSRLHELEAAQRYEAQLTRLNEDLARSNLDLERFARVAAHDLSAPLRASLRLTSWITQDLGTEAPAQVRENLAAVSRRLQGMQQMLQDLLAWARAGKAKPKREFVDVSALARELWADLAAPGFVLECSQPAGTVLTLRAPLTQMLRNVLANAVRHHDGSDGKVVVSHRAQGDDLLEISVQDDGPGITPEMRGRVFEMGVSHTPGRPKGTGIGLAVVERIARQLGGSVWFDPPTSDGRGLTVRFTLPAG